MSSICRSIINHGFDGRAVTSECHLSRNLPTIVIVGHANQTVREAGARLRGAFAASQLTLPRRRITINLAPADLPKTDSGLDLAIALSILAADQQIAPIATDTAAIGELGLDGSLRPIRGVIGKLLAGRRIGIREYIIPIANLAQAQLVPDVVLYPAGSLREAVDHLTGKRLITPVFGGETKLRHTSIGTPDWGLIVGQNIAKQAVVIAAAGGHNLLLSGPPGTGKSVLARCLADLLPPLSATAALETTQLHSLVGDSQNLHIRPPLRSPHHTTTDTALIGSGQKPGEISLSHHGVLFLDEFPEFRRSALEALRQPMESHAVTLVRAGTATRFPANFQLIATANPCPCGYAGNERCRCSAAAKQRYYHKLSGPILDRIDLWCSVAKVDLAAISKKQPTESVTKLKEQIATARKWQSERYKNSTTTNATATMQQLRAHAELSPAAQRQLASGAAAANLSARGYHKVLAVARTIADLENKPRISEKHVAQALSFRLRPETPV